MENKDIKRIHISIMDTVEDYEKAIDITCRILYSQGVVTESYYHAILENIKKYGGYFYLGEGVCMPHARSEDGVLETGLCILKLNNAVDFKGNSVNLFFTLAAENKKDHMGLLKKIAEVCSRSDILWKIHKAQRNEEIIRLLEFEDEKNYDCL